MNNFIELLSDLNIPNDSIQNFVSKLKCIHLKKDEYFLQQGDYCKYMGYLPSGKIRYYTVDIKGTEHTLWFNTIPNFIGDYNSFLRKTNAVLGVQVMCDCDLIILSYDQMMTLFEFNSETQKFRTSLAEDSMFGWGDLALSFYCHTAEERYLELLKEHPNIEQEIPIKHIASVIGITPETLSRMRAKLKKEGSTL